MEAIKNTIYQKLYNFLDEGKRGYFEILVGEMNTRAGLFVRRRQPVGTIVRCINQKVV